MNIIIIDDDRKAAETLKSKLTEYDEIEIIGMAHNGMDGLRLYNDSKPDLMFLDVDMPDISGIEFLERIDIKTACLLVDKRCLHEHWVGSFCQNIGDFLISDGQTELLCLFSYDFVLYKRVPYHVLYSVELLVIEVLLSLLHLDDFGVFINKFLEFLYVNLFS